MNEATLRGELSSDWRYRFVINVKENHYGRTVKVSEEHNANIRCAPSRTMSRP